MKQKIFILGATGMAGHMIYNYLNASNNYELHTTCYRNPLNEKSHIIDIHDVEKLKDLLINITPDIIINCVGLLIKGCEQSKEDAIYINAYFPHLLSKMITQNSLKTKIFHISTDCVFSGKKGNYTDNDIKDALDIYGMTKNLGELINDTDLTIRTSIIGPELKTNGEGLFHWLFSNRNQKKIDGYTKSLWSGVTTLELAKTIDFSLQHNLTGLYQLSNNQKITKCDLLELIVKQFNFLVAINPVDGMVSDKSILASKAKPIDYTVPSYTQMIKELYNYMHTNKHLYNQYLE